MINKGVTPAIVVFSSLVYGLCTIDKWERDEELIHEMLDEGIRPDVVFFSTLICNLCNIEPVRFAEKPWLKVLFADLS
jgi:leucine-rich PPR motif-containing protein